MSKKNKPEISARRRFFTDTAHHAGLGLLGGLLWAGYADKSRGSVLTLRPPGALPEEDFLRTCIKCGQCVEACRNRESNIDKETGKPRPETLIMAKSDAEGVAIGTPYFVAKEVPCYMCDDIPCVPVCPSGALDEASVTNDEGELDFRKMDMGVAVVDTNSCIAFWGLQCDACYRACPLMDEAIKLKYNRNSRTGKHAFLEPVIDPEICTGCGLCERACVTEKPAIFVLPREIAQGRPGDHYVKGWDKKDQQRAGDRKDEDITTHTKRSEKEAADYLNDGVSYE
jgi:ferredoxin-type protein NapG